MVKYLEISNALKTVDDDDGGGGGGGGGGAGGDNQVTDRYLVFIAGNALLVEVGGEGRVAIRINRIHVEVATVYLNDALSFVPCFKYVDSEDIILFTSRQLHYLVDKGGQFNENYYGMKHELIECITSEQVYVDLNDEHVFKAFKLSELLTESKTVLHAPDYLLQARPHATQLGWHARTLPS